MRRRRASTRFGPRRERCSAVCAKTGAMWSTFASNAVPSPPPPASTLVSTKPPGPNGPRRSCADGSFRSKTRRRLPSIRPRPSPTTGVRARAAGHGDRSGSCFSGTPAAARGAVTEGGCFTGPADGDYASPAATCARRDLGGFDRHPRSSGHHVPARPDPFFAARPGWFCDSSVASRIWRFR